MNALIQEARLISEAAVERIHAAAEENRRREAEEFQRLVRKAADKEMSRLPGMVRAAADQGEYRVQIYRIRGLKDRFRIAVKDELVNRCREQGINTESLERKYSSRDHDYSCDLYVVWGS